MDSCTAHKTATVRRWLAHHPRGHVKFTLINASWLNEVGASLPCSRTNNCGEGHHLTREIEQAIRNYIDTVNAN